MIKKLSYVPTLLFVALPIVVICYFYSGSIKSVTKVVDGDTIYFGARHKCRASFIDSPESSRNSKLKRDRESCQNITEEKFVTAGLLSKEYANTILPVGSEAQVKVLDIDRYKRKVCSIEPLNVSIDFSKEMVSSGFAIPYSYYIPSDQIKKWGLLVESAKKENAGLWESHYDVMNCMYKVL